jgi:hypothetical protein
MKHVIFPAILAVTLPLWAAEQKQAATPQPEDSPLVAAAKRSGRLNKKPSFVITNETLLQMNGGRVSTATTPYREIVMPAPLPPLQPTPEMVAGQIAAKERDARARIATEQKKAQEQRATRAQQRASQYQDESYLDDDPAAAEHAIEQMTKQPAQKPPQE